MQEPKGVATGGVRKYCHVVFEEEGWTYILHGMSAMEGCFKRAQTWAGSKKQKLWFTPALKECYSGGTGTRFEDWQSAGILKRKASNKNSTSSKQPVVKTPTAALLELGVRSRQHESAVAREEKAPPSVSVAQGCEGLGISGVMETMQGVESNFGLHGNGYGIRRNKDPIPLKPEHEAALRSLFDRGNIEGQTHCSPAEAWEFLMQTLMLNDWFAQLNLSADRIKTLFSQWTSKRKKELATNGTAASKAV